MAALLRMSCVQGLNRGLALMTSREMICRRLASKPAVQDARHDEVSSAGPVKKKWVSYGFSDKNEAEDRHAMHQTLFVVVTICFVLGGTAVAYLPDSKGKDWAQREAYLRLRYREEHGLPPIDHNLIDPSNINLPSDEELGDTEIII